MFRGGGRSGGGGRSPGGRGGGGGRGLILIPITKLI
jgi:hypothetical protein